VVNVISGANENELPLGGRTVGFARQNLGAIYNIAAGATATVNTREVGDDYVLSDGDDLVFASRQAEKG